MWKLFYNFYYKNKSSSTSKEFETSRKIFSDQNETEK